MVEVFWQTGAPRGQDGNMMGKNKRGSGYEEGEKMSE